MRVGLIGYGAWGRIHATSIKSLANHELVAIACKSQDTARQALKDHPQCRITTNHLEIIASNDIDVVDIVVPNHLHVPFAVAALEAGKHVLLEKPMAPDSAAADRLVAAAQKSDKSVSLIHELRCSEQWSWLKSAIDRGDIGSPRYILLNLFRFPYRTGKDGWRYRPENVGSWVLEEPIHFIDLMLWYFEKTGAPTAVTAFTNPGEKNLSQDFTAVFEFPSGAYGVISQTLSAFEHHQVIEISGSEGAIRSIWSGAMDRTDKPIFSVTAQSRGDDAPVQIRLEHPSGEIFEIQEYIRVAMDGLAQGRSLYTVEKARKLVEFCLAAEQSAREHRRIELT
jgi:myo-inositol 2-dehydrogenase / D-chiro-inositol 1-dehydrogenase